MTQRKHRVLLELRKLGWQKIYFENLYPHVNRPPGIPDFRSSIYRKAVEILGDPYPVHEIPVGRYELHHHTYSKLKDSHGFVRLLKLMPNFTRNDPIQAEMIVISLDDAPDYAALSYSWGSTKGSRFMELNNNTWLGITASLHAVLYELRQHGYTYVWADAVCINQADDTERSEQVTQMTRIYETAYEVIVHPGCYCNNATHRAHDHGVRLMKMLSLASSVIQAVRPERPNLERTELEKFGIPDQPRNRSWQKIRSQPWYQRAWVVQEVLVNPNVRIFLNGSLFKFGDVAAANAVMKVERIDAR